MALHGLVPTQSSLVEASPPSARPRAARPAATTGRLGPMDRVLARCLQRRLEPVAVRLRVWDGSSPYTGSTPPVGELHVKDRRALAGLIVDPDLRFGEAYMAGRVEVPGDIVPLLEALSRLGPSKGLVLREWLARLAQPRTTIGRARHNVHHHYDLGNDFYARWLDREMLYTCAYYREPAMTLEEAQVAKMDLVCRKLRIQPGETVVEAGCGWGGLALHMARAYGARVRAFNLSTEQIRYARERARREGLADRVEFIEDDYRNVTGGCDVFVSVGMLEHVGRAQYPALAAVLRRTLRDATGRGLLHFIGRDRPRPLNAWIRRRIFPGAYPPTVAEVATRVLEPAGQVIHDVENLRLHYARTLGHWLDRFEQAADEIRREFDDPFVRAWRLYLAGSQAAFTTAWLQLFQIVFAPRGGRFVRWTREDGR